MKGQRNGPNQIIRDIVAMYRKYRFPEPERPEAIDNELMQMRLNFLLEELLEIAGASGFKLMDTHCEDEITEVVNLETECPHFEWRPSADCRPNLEEVLDGLIDLIVVAVGTCYLGGYLRPYKDCTIFDEAWSRVHRANMQKEVGRNAKRGNHSLDLVKPEGWTPPKFDDLV